MIVFNPPYLPLDEREDRKSAKITTGGVRGDEIIIKFLRDADNYLEEGGIILLLISSLTPVDRINKIIQKKKFVKRKVSEKKMFMEKLEVWEIRKN